MKKDTSKTNLSWTKWFFPSLYISDLVRRKKPEWRPQTPAMMERYHRKANLLTFSYVMIAWTALGYVILKLREADDDQIPRGENEKHLRTLARFNRPESFDDADRKILIYKYKGFSKGEVLDVTEDVKKIVVPDLVFDKYKDLEYLSRRANLSKDDERFDPEFWEAYFRKIDNNPSVNQSIGKNVGQLKESLGL